MSSFVFHSKEKKCHMFKFLRLHNDDEFHECEHWAKKIATKDDKFNLIKI